MTNTLQRYKPIPELTELNPGYEAGWKFQVLILQAEPDDKMGSIILSQTTLDDEKGASVVARIVDISPTAFRHSDWEAVMGDKRPYERGDLILTKRYPPGCKVQGADGRTYLMVTDDEIIGRHFPEAFATAKAAA